MIKADYHTHTPLCHHASGTPEQFIEAALKAGLTEYGIADHAPMPDEPFDEWRMTNDELPAYFAWIDECKRLAPPELTIRVGLECDWVEGIEDWIAHLNSLYPWDYLIGSIHYLGDKGNKWGFDNPVFMNQWRTLNLEAAWSLYWETYASMAKSNLFDILGHADLIKKFGFIPQGDLRRFYDPVIATIAKSDAAIELNTSGWHKDCDECFPSSLFLKLAAEAHIPLTVNSDAHSPAELARDLDKGYALARSAGFSHLTLFNKRKKYPSPLR